MNNGRSSVKAAKRMRVYHRKSKLRVAIGYFGGELRVNHRKGTAYDRGITTSEPL